MSFKHLFSLPQNLTYFNAAYMGPVPNSARDEGIKALIRRSQDIAQITPDDFFSGSERLRKEVGQALKVPAANIALIPAVSYGVEIAVKALAPGRDREILFPQDDFPSNIYPWQNWAKLSGAKMVCVERPSDFDWTRAVIERISDKTDVVSVPLNDWSDGTRFDLAAISKACKKVGAKLVVDVSQSLGAVPLNITGFDPDFLVSVGYKWQLGPYGLTYMYVADRWFGAAPLENGWLNRKGSEDFSRLVEYQEDYQPGARRFDCGQRAQLLLTPIAIESMRFLNEIGFEKIFSHNQGLAARLHSELSKLGFDLPPRERLTGHMIGARHKAFADMRPLATALKENGFAVSARGTALRMSPHIYNNMDDVEALCAAIAKNLKLI